MEIKSASKLAFAIVILAVFYLVRYDYLFSKNPVSITIQILAALLMVWARITLGVRSFHPTANPTEGELITRGPYRWLRHPVYAAIIYFTVAATIAHPILRVIVAVSIVVAGLVARMLLEEKSLRLTYNQYDEYSKRTKRVIPFIL